MTAHHHADDGGPAGTLTLRIGHDELVVRRRYEVLGIVNDLLIGLWLLVGHILLFSAALETWGLSLLLVGSVLMTARGVIRIARLVHIGRVRGRTGPRGEGTTA